MTPQAFINELGDAVRHDSLPAFILKCQTNPEYKHWSEKLANIIKVYERKAGNVPASIYLTDDPSGCLYV